MSTSRIIEAQEKQELWEGRLSDYLDSDLGPVAYCRAHGLRANQFYYWKKKIEAFPQQPEKNAGSTQRSKKFDSLTQGSNKKLPGPKIPLQLVQISPPLERPMDSPHPSGVALHIGDRYRIEMAGDFDTAVLARILKVLEAL